MLHSVEGLSAGGGGAPARLFGPGKGSRRGRGCLSRAIDSIGLNDGRRRRWKMAVPRAAAAEGRQLKIL